ncbi:MAG TPA: DUF2752 domain-containing protein [Armatimonadota bacterium]
MTAAGPGLAPARSRAEDRLLRFAILAVYAVSFALPIGQLDRTGFVVCAFRHFTGLPCPGCGMTHAFVAISHGMFAEAWHYNALSFAAYAGGLAWLVAPFVPAGLRRRLPHPGPRTRTRLWWGALAVTLAFGLFRILVPAARPF